jgi:hypothetical protein
VDGAAGHVYWAVGGEIWRADLDGSNKTLLLAIGNTVRGISLDVTGGWMYFGAFSGLDGERGTARRAHLDGTDAGTIIGEIRNGPYDVCVDPQAGKIYWTRNNSEPDTGRVQRANLDGSETETIAVDTDAESLELDLARGKIYWTTFDSGSYPDTTRINRANLDGSDPEVLPVEGLIPRGVAVLGEAGPPCPGDFDGDGVVGLYDLAQLLGHFGMTEGATHDDGDLDADGDVDLEDLAELFSLYGTVCA